jgi:hypothetical protein
VVSNNKYQKEHEEYHYPYGDDGGGIFPQYSYYRGQQIVEERMFVMEEVNVNFSPLEDLPRCMDYLKLVMIKPSIQRIEGNNDHQCAKQKPQRPGVINVSKNTIWLHGILPLC